eukprot:3188018-Rhodomonas_salina.2
MEGVRPQSRRLRRNDGMRTKRMLRCMAEREEEKKEEQEREERGGERGGGGGRMTVASLFTHVRATVSPREISVGHGAALRRGGMATVLLHPEISTRNRNFSTMCTRNVVFCIRVCSVGNLSVLEQTQRVREDAMTLAQAVSPHTHTL